MSGNKEDEHIHFQEMELDDRILKGIAKLGWQTSTLVQEKAVPLILEGKDVLIRARTGSGKTAAFLIPIIQKILGHKQVAQCQEIKTIILAPSKELCNQIFNVLKNLTIKCSREVRCVDIAAHPSLNTQKPLLIEKPDIVIATPSRILQHFQAGNLDVKKSLDLLVIDEADLIFSFGYESNVKDMLVFLPKIYQAILASATLSEEVLKLKSLILHNPVALKLEEPDLAPSVQLAHYHLQAEEMDKASILYALLKLHLVKGKTIIFVNTVDKSYKLKLYLEQFAIPSCVLNSELPSSIRCHTVNQFNQGIYNIIIASDEKSLDVPGNVGSKFNKRRKDKESGVSRGIDFQFLSNVINFDFPLDVNSYIHRAGRTARGNNQGSVLSFVSTKELSLFEQVEKHLQEIQCEKTILKAYNFKIEEIEAFRYRAKDAWRAVTRIAVREARLKEIKQEIFNSQILKSYFEDNPTDLQVLRHDKALHTVKIQKHLADVPDYIVPSTLQNFAGKRKRKTRKNEFCKTLETSCTKFKIKRNNPLNPLSIMKFEDRTKLI